MIDNNCGTDVPTGLQQQLLMGKKDNKVLRTPDCLQMVLVLNYFEEERKIFFVVVNFIDKWFCVLL